MTVSEIIQSAHDDIEFSVGIIASSINEKKSDLIRLNYDWTVRCYLTLGLLYWRNGQDPRPYLNQMLESALTGIEVLKAINGGVEGEERISLEATVYASSLVGLPHPAINLDTQEDHTLASAFFGNVLIGAADIADWPKYDRLPKTKRYQLANETDALYGGLLAGHITPEEGVPLAEELWARREDDDYFQSGGEGGGDENHQIVDYRLGAILKKIGSTVPTVHAWRW